MRKLLLLTALLPALAAGQDVRPAPVAGPPGATVVASGEEVLAEVNAQRAQRNLPPFLLDPRLTEAAFKCAVWRARTRTEGHTPNDFTALAPGVHADCSGCAAWPVSMGFGACELYGSHRYAGAAFCVGTDGRRYMHVFYHN